MASSSGDFKRSGEDVASVEGESKEIKAVSEHDLFFLEQAEHKFVVEGDYDPYPDAPDHLRCPISYAVMTQPVIPIVVDKITGIPKRLTKTYDFQSLEKNIKANRAHRLKYEGRVVDDEVFTLEDMSFPGEKGQLIVDTISNYALLAIIAEYKKNHPIEGRPESPSHQDFVPLMKIIPTVDADGVVHFISSSAPEEFINKHPGILQRVYHNPENVVEPVADEAAIDIQDEGVPVALQADSMPEILSKNSLTLGLTLGMITFVINLGYHLTDDRKDEDFIPLNPFILTSGGGIVTGIPNYFISTTNFPGSRSSKNFLRHFLSTNVTTTLGSLAASCVYNQASTFSAQLVMGSLVYPITGFAMAFVHDGLPCVSKTLSSVAGMFGSCFRRRRPIMANIDDEPFIEIAPRIGIV